MRFLDILSFWMVVMFHLALRSKALPVKMIATGLDGKGTRRLLGVKKVWRGAALQSVSHQENGNSWRILAL